MSQARILTCPVEGAIVAYDVNGLLKGVLLAGSDYAPQVEVLQADQARLIEAGRLALRLGVALHDRPFLFVPHSIIDESGVSFQGEVVFDWLRARAYDMPRAEVFGVNASGQEDRVFARDIDVESSPVVVGGAETSPVYVAVCVGAMALPPRFSEALKSISSSEIGLLRPIVEAA